MKLDALPSLGAADASNLPKAELTYRTIGEVHADGSTGARAIETSIVPDMTVTILQTGLRHVDEVPSPAGVLLGAYGERCLVWGIWPNSKDYNFLVSERLLKPVESDYLSELRSLDEPDVTRAQHLAEGLIELIERDEVDCVTWLPMNGLSFDDEPATVGPVTMRRLTGQEIGDLYPIRSHRRRTREPWPWFSAAHPHEQWVMDFRTSCSRDDQPGAGMLPQKFVLALQLLGFEPHGRGYAAHWTEPGPSLSNGFQIFRMPRTGVENACTVVELQRALTLADAMPDSAIYSPTSTSDIALNRYAIGAAEETLTEALIDYVIALEALLLSGTDSPIRRA